MEFQGVGDEWHLLGMGTKETGSKCDIAASHAMHKWSPSSEFSLNGFGKPGHVQVKIKRQVQQAGEWNCSLDPICECLPCKSQLKRMPKPPIWITQYGLHTMGKPPIWITHYGKNIEGNSLQTKLHDPWLMNHKPWDFLLKLRFMPILTQDTTGCSQLLYFTLSTILWNELCWESNWPSRGKFPVGILALLDLSAALYSLHTQCPHWWFLDAGEDSLE